MNISPNPTFDPLPPQDLMDSAMRMPFSPLTEAAIAAGQGFGQTTIGLGIRDLTLPPRAPVPIAANRGEFPADYLRRRDEAIAAAGPSRLSEDQWKTSPYYRQAIPYDPGMTEDRAAALAQQYDVNQAKAQMLDRDNWTGPFGLRLPNLQQFLGGLAGQIVDPINFVPILGPEVRAAAVARFGFMGHLMTNASEAALNTAAWTLLTRQQRAALGDDISWQGDVLNIAMGALLGAAVTPIIHRFSGDVSASAEARAASRVQTSAETVANAEVSRAILNDAVTGVALDGEVKLSPASEGAVQRLAADVTARRDAQLSLSRETSGITADKGVVISPSGARVEATPQVVELADLIKATGDLQVRDRSRAASTAQIEEMAARLDAARLMPSVEADRGAPLVGQDNIVDSGNGRVAAIQRAYEAYPDQAQAYRNAIEKAGYSTEGFSQPVLIQRRTTDLSPEARAQFNAEANQSATARMSPSELAAMDRGALDSTTLGLKADGPITSAENRPFVQRFLANIPGNERASLVDANGALSMEGARRVENALVAAAYGDVDAGVVSRFSEATDDNSRSIVGAMADVAGKWALMRRAMATGELNPEYDVTPELTSALRKLSQWREQAAREGRPVPQVIKEGMAQLDMLDGEMSLEAKTMVRAFYRTDDFVRSAGREAIATRLSKIADAAEELGRPQLFADAEAATKLGVISHAINDQPADLFAPQDFGEGTDGRGQGGTQSASGSDRGNAAQGLENGAGDRSGAAASRIAYTMAQRFEAAGRPSDEARAAGTLVGSFYDTMAARLGVSPADLETRFGLPDVRAAEMPVEAQAAMFQAAPPVDSEAFNRWFGDSKVVDEHGAPLVVYHSTSAPDFDRFRRRTGDVGIHFGTVGQAEDRANYMRGRKGGDLAVPREGERMLPVYLSIKNPLRLSDAGSWTADDLFYQLRDNFPNDIDRIKRLNSTKDVREFIQSKGYDGIVYKNTGEANDAARMAELRAETNAANDALIARQKALKLPLNSYTAEDQKSPEYKRWHDAYQAERAFREGEGSADSYIAFSPTQVKSVFNRGTFDPNDPRILFQPAYHGSPHIFDRFSSDKIGTGEGAQAFGHGLYFAGRKEVAKYYRDTLAAQNRKIPTPVMDALREVDLLGFDSAGQAMTAIRQHPDDWVNRWDATSLGPEKIAAINDYAKAGPNKGRLYKVDIPDDSELMIWDAPLSEQPEKVRDFFEKNLKFDWGVNKGTGARAAAAPDGTMLYVIRAKDGTWRAEAPAQKDPMIAQGLASETDAQAAAQKWALDHMTGEQAYRQVSKQMAGPEPTETNSWTSVATNTPGSPRMSGDAALSAALREAGIPGHKFLDQQSRMSSDATALIKAQGSREAAHALALKRAEEASIPKHRQEWEKLARELEAEQTYNYVIYDDSRINVTGYEQKARGAINFGDNGRSIISLFKSADASTAAHELGHHFLHMFKSLAEADGAPLALKRDMESLKQWWASNAEDIAAESPSDGVTGADVLAVLEKGTSGDRVKDIAIDVGLQEQWARGFESYLRDGQAPSQGLVGLFEQFKRWLTSIYQSARDLKVEISPEIRRVFDRMLAKDAADKAVAPAPTRQPALDFTPPKPEPRPEGLDEAAARVGTSEDIKAMAAQHGVNPDGSFAEQSDIEMLREQGQLTKEDEAELAAADTIEADAKAWGDALKTAARCAFGAE